jgi:hypothetical protein
VRSHFTPTRASWLNQVEVWFSILAGKSLPGASINSLAGFKAYIDAFTPPTPKPHAHSIASQQVSARNASNHLSPFSDSR